MAVEPRETRQDSGKLWSFEIDLGTSAKPGELQGALRKLWSFGKVRVALKSLVDVQECFGNFGRV